MTEETRAEIFIRLLTEAYNEDRDRRERQRRLRLKFDVKRFVDEFRTVTLRGRSDRHPPGPDTAPKRMPGRPTAAE